MGEMEDMVEIMEVMEVGNEQNLSIITEEVGVIITEDMVVMEVMQDGVTVVILDGIMEVMEATKVGKDLLIMITEETGAMEAVIMADGAIMLEDIMVVMLEDGIMVVMVVGIMVNLNPRAMEIGENPNLAQVQVVGQAQEVIMVDGAMDIMAIITEETGEMEAGIMEDMVVTEVGIMVVMEQDLPQETGEMELDGIMVEMKQDGIMEDMVAMKQDGIMVDQTQETGAMEDGIMQQAEDGEVMEGMGDGIMGEMEEMEDGQTERIHHLMRINQGTKETIMMEGTKENRMERENEMEVNIKLSSIFFFDKSLING